jgi:hypothetical protein
VELNYVLRYNPSVTLRKADFIAELYIAFFLLVYKRLALTHHHNIRFIRNCFLNTRCNPPCALLTPLLKLARFLFCPVRLLFFTRLHHSWRDIFLPRFHSRMDMPAYSAVMQIWRSLFHGNAGPNACNASNCQCVRYTRKHFKIY